MSRIWDFFTWKKSSSLTLSSSTLPLLGALPFENPAAGGAAMVDIKDVGLASDFVILVFGDAGSGKSTIINLIAERDIVPINNQLEATDNEFKVVRLRVLRGDICLIEVPESQKTRFYSLYQRYNVIGVIFVLNVNDRGLIKGPLRVDWDQIKEVRKKDLFLGSQLIYVTTHWATPQYDNSEDLKAEKLLMASEDGGGSNGGGRGQAEFRRFALEKPEEARTILVDLLAREQGSAEILWKECSDGDVHASHAYQIIVVMGETGTGKSNFIAKAINNPKYNSQGDTLDSVTGKIQALKVHIDSHRFILVDTPGFNDTNRSDYEILEMIAKWLEDTFKHKILLDGVLYFHRITDNRMGGNSARNLRTFRALAGKGLVSQNIRFVTTMWDIDVEGKGQAREDGMASKFWGTMIREGATVKQFRNSHQSAREILKSFRVDWHRQYALQLQTELVNEHQKLKATRAGQSVYDKLCEGLKDLEKVLERIENAERNGEALGEDERENIIADVEKLQRDMQKLRVGIGGELRKLLRRLFWHLF